MSETTIFYSDGTTFDLGPIDRWRDNPPRKGVQFIKTDGKILRPADYYLYRPSLDMWTEHVDSASVIVAAAKENWVCLLLGEYIPDERFKQILAETMK